MPKLQIRSRGTSVSYELWMRRRGTKDWEFNSTPDSLSAEQNVLQWAKSNPEFEYRLDKTTKIRQTITVVK